MRRLTVFIWSFLCFTVLPLAVTPQEEFIPSPEFIRSRIRNAYSTIQDLQCYVRIIKVRNGNKRKSNAKLYFKPPGKILLKFTRPRRQVICSNGKTLWIYVPKLNVVFSHTFSSDEKKERSTPLASSALKMKLFQDYRMSFAKEKIVKLPELNKHRTYYAMRLTPKVSQEGYREIRIWVSRRGYIHRIIGTNYNGNTTQVDFRAIKINQSIVEDFDFEQPDNCQEMSNPFTNLEN